VGTDAEKTVNEIIQRNTSELMDVSFSCVCGRTHEIPIKYLSIKRGAVDEIRQKMDDLGIEGRGALVFDRRIGDDVVKPVSDRISARGVDLTPFPDGVDNGLIPPEIARSEEIAARIRGKADFLISIGSGVISDLTKNAAQVLGLPYILVATAPSMNGYTSSMAALTENGIKKTVMVRPSSAIFADTDILCRAPVEMVRSGLGDIVSKSVCNADWKLSNIVKKTYFCPVPFRITDKTEPLYLDAAGEIGKRTESGISALTDGVMRSGLSMTVIGISTPSSGAEHFISHYWDLAASIEKKPKLFHGVQVGVATLIAIRLYDYFLGLHLGETVNMKRLEESYPSKESCSEFIDKKFGRFAAGVKEEFFSKYMDWGDKKRELEFIMENRDSIAEEISPYLRPAAPVEKALREAGAAAVFSDLGKTRDEAADALYNARFMRSRYTILDLVNELGLMEKAVEHIC